MELQPDVQYNLKKVGFAYPEDFDIDSLEQLKYHDLRLTQIKDALLLQQNKLKSALQNLKINKKSK